MKPTQDRHDVVFFDQRGTGLSEPSLRCPEVRDNVISSFAEDLRAPEDAARTNAALLKCHDRLAGEGVDFGAYNSAASASDVADVMSALGYGDYSIYGISYGTRLALTVMRDHPEHVRSVVLDSTLPPPGHWLVRGGQELRPCAEHAVRRLQGRRGLQRRVPEPGEQDFFDLVAKLNKEPVIVEPQDPSTQKTARVVINGDRLARRAHGRRCTTHSSFQSCRSRPRRSRKETLGLLNVLAEQIVFSFADLSDGMAASVNCHDETPFNTEETVTEANRGVRKEIVDSGYWPHKQRRARARVGLCNAWGAGTADARENEAVSSDIPTLILAGEYDPITPPAWGKLAAQTLSHSFVVEFPATGHGALSGQFPCASTIMAAFRDDPSKQPDTSCTAAIPPPAFQVP